MGDVEQEIWDAYNTLLLGPDVERLRKLLARYHLFSRTLDVPGDVVECGVFKGSGLMLWLKLLAIRCPGSRKRVVGFDLFDRFAATADDVEAKEVAAFVDEAKFSGTSPEQLFGFIRAAGLDPERCDLVPGEIETTARDYTESHPGFRISLLHLDLDLHAGTLAALEVLWPRVSPGGIAVFDNYSVPRWTESGAVDRFFASSKFRLETLTWARTPAAFAVKE